MSKEKKFMTMDGNTAAAMTAYGFSEVAGIYPITPSSPMADMVDQWAQAGRKNIFGQEVEVVEMQSEAGAAAVVHGSLGTGALTTTFTASQGLLLMIPNMYKIAGELLPAVFHVAARTVATHALSIFGDHSDVMACRQTGFAMLASASVQEAHDLAAIAHLAAIKGRVPFLHFFDGFRTSHEIQKIEVLDTNDLASLVDQEALEAFRNRALSPNHPTQRGTAQNPDIFFQVSEAANPYYLAIPEIVKNYMDEFGKITGREYAPYVYTGAEDADRLIICMGSVAETVKETVNYLNAHGEKVGVLNVHLYRPFAIEMFLDAIPKTVKRIAVLDRCKEPGATAEPMYLDVVDAYKNVENAPTIVGGRYGLSSKDTDPDQIFAVFKMLAEDPKQHFTIGINDDVTHLSLPVGKNPDVAPEGLFAARFWGLGSDGTVGANKNSIKIIGDHTPMYAQAYFSYDSKKSGGITISDLRFGKTPIHLPYLVNQADFIACHNQAYLDKYDILGPLKEGGSFLLNTVWKKEELEEKLPNKIKRELAEKHAKFYIVDAVELASSIGLRGRINTICQSAFFKIANIIPIEDAVKYMKEAIQKSYGHKGDDIVRMNNAAVDAGVDAVQEVEVPSEWASLQDDPKPIRVAPDFVKNIADVMNGQMGNMLPVSTFVGMEDGTFPNGTSSYEKRGIASIVPSWQIENCIQCNQCSYVCPHAVIRPFLATPEEAAELSDIAFKDGVAQYKEYKYRIQISVMDCTGCGSCAAVCPAPKKALVMEPIEKHFKEAEHWEKLNKLPRKPNPMNKNSVKGLQFEKPLFEFSGACPGCGETPYIKALSQMVGDRLQISNATGCSSIYGGSAPSNPYTTNADGHGPTWANSLFEDAAEHGLGMRLGYKQIRERAVGHLKELCELASGQAELQEAIKKFIDTKEEGEGTRAVVNTLVEALESAKLEGKAAELARKVLAAKDYLVKRSFWVVGGDGFAYDIGYGGLDHVLSTGEDINVLVLDTEVYSNTGGQASKSTPLGAVAEFAAGGKPVSKKDLGLMAMSYGYVYVAQIAMGANQAQTIKAIQEAEAYHGPSLIIAYSPCISHGIKGGMSRAMQREKDAVETGYWHLYRFNPELKKEGKNPFVLDSKDPTRPYTDFLNEEVRYKTLRKRYSEEKVQEIFEKSAESAKERYGRYKFLASRKMDQE